MVPSQIRSEYICRVLKECQSEEVEDVCHWMIRCPTWDYLNFALLEEGSHCDGFKDRVSTSRLLLNYPWHVLIILGVSDLVCDLCCCLFVLNLLCIMV